MSSWWGKDGARDPKEGRDIRDDGNQLEKQRGRTHNNFLMQVQYHNHLLESNAFSDQSLERRKWWDLAATRRRKRWPTTSPR